MNAISRIGLIFFVLLAVGCSTTSGPVPVSDRIPVPTTPQQEVQPKVSPAPKPARTLPLSASLAKQATAKLREQQWQQAIVLAERGLRIDRKEPRFYWVLASAYKGLNDIRQSSYFARQGLRYVVNNDLLKQELANLAGK